MTTSTPSTLSFAALREANRQRMPQFKNKHGEPAHSQPDGSDWSPAQWLQALIGEVGEYARVRHLYETGQMGYDEFVIEAKKELADVQCYLDLLSLRALDKVESAPAGPDVSQSLQQLVAGLGEYANWRKKLERGDLTPAQFEAVGLTGLAEVAQQLPLLEATVTDHAKVVVVHPTGVDLGGATTSKFNEVSRRVGATVLLPE